MQNKKVVHTFILLLLLTTTLIGWATYRIALATDDSGGSPEAAETQLVDDALDNGKEVNESESEEPLIKETEEVTEVEEVSEEPAEMTEAESTEPVEVTETESTEPVEVTEQTEAELAEEPASESIPVVTESEVAIAQGAESSESSDDLLKASAGPEDLLDQLDQDVLTEELLEEEDEVEAEFEAGEYTVDRGSSWEDATGKHFAHKYNPSKDGMYSPWAWCLDHGKHDSSSWTWDGMQQLGSKAASHRKAAAIAWFYEKSDQGLEAYKAVQYIIWGNNSSNFSGTLKSYMETIEALASRNSQYQDISNGTQIGKLKKIAKGKVGTDPAAYYKELQATDIDKDRSYTYAPTTDVIKDAIKQGFLKPVMKDGKPVVKYGKTTNGKTTVQKATVDKTNGTITWTFSGKWAEKDQIVVYLEMSGNTYVGNRVGVLEPTGDGNQRFAIGTEGAADYFCIGVKLPEVKKNDEYPKFQLDKVDADGRHVVATFEVRYFPWTDVANAHGVVAPQPIPGSEFDSGSYDANGNWVPHVVDMGELWKSMKGAEEEDLGWFHVGTDDEPRADGHYYVFEVSVGDEFVKTDTCVYHFCMTSREVTDNETLMKTRYYGMYNAQKTVSGKNDYVLYPNADTATDAGYTLIGGIGAGTITNTTTWGAVIDTGSTTDTRKNTGKDATVNIVNEHYHAGAEFYKQQYVMTKVHKLENGDIAFDWGMQGDNESRFILRADSEIRVNGVVKYNKDQIIFPKDKNHVSLDNVDAQGSNYYELWADDSKWSNSAGCQVDYVDHPNNDGQLWVTGLPIGSYRFEETKHSSSNPGMSPIYFIIDGSGDVSTWAAGTEHTMFPLGSMVNMPIDASVMVLKKDENDQPLAGTEITLYISCNVKNYLGGDLFTEDEKAAANAAEVVTSYRESDGTMVPATTSTGWVRVTSKVTGADGSVYFDSLPYGKYLVAETKPTEGYAFGEESSFEFEHTLAKAIDPTNVFTSRSNSFTQIKKDQTDPDSPDHSIKNKKIKLEVQVSKVGDAVVASTDETSVYGGYKKLKVEKRALNGIQFGLKTLPGETIVTKDDGTPLILTTNALGKASAYVKEPGSYLVYEVSGDSLHLKTDLTRQVDLAYPTGTEAGLKTVVFADAGEFDNELIGTSITVPKVGEVPVLNAAAGNGDALYIYEQKPLAGVVFGFYANETINGFDGTAVLKKDDCVGYAVTGNDGNAVLNEKLLPGKYYAKEIKTGDEYRLNGDKHEFDLVANGQDLSITLDEVVNEHTRGNVELLKVDVTPDDDGNVKNTPLAGVEFELKNADGTVLHTYTTNADGKIVAESLPLGTYYFHETKALEEYFKLVTDVPVVITKDGDTITGRADNTKVRNRIKVYKHGVTVTGVQDKQWDGQDDYKALVREDKPLKGVKFTIKSVASGQEWTITTGEDGYAESEDLPLGEYEVREAQTITGSKLSDEVKKVTLTMPDKDPEDVVYENVEFVNDVVNTDVSVYKIGEVPYLTEGIKPGDPKFAAVTVDKDSAYTFVDEPVKGVLFGFYAKEPIKGYDDSVLIEAGKCVGYAVTGDDGKCTMTEPLLTGKYYFKELQAPEEYVMDSKEYEFSLTVGSEDVSEDLNPTEPVKNERRKAAIKLRKKDQKHAQLLAGVEFDLYTEKDEFVGKYATDDNGEILVTGLPLGKYVFKETKPLTDYYGLESDVEVTITEHGKVFLYEVDNDKDEHFVRVYKHGPVVTGTVEADFDGRSYKALKVEDHALKGVVFRIENEAGEVVDELTTGDDGKAQSKALKNGVYWVYEVSVDETHKPSTERKKVVFEGAGPNRTLEFQDLDFENALCSTVVSVYKEGEVPYLAEDVTEFPVEDDGVYTFHREPLEGAVFGFYAKETIVSYDGAVLLNAGDCVGYAESDENGVARLSVQMMPGTYAYKELDAPEGFKLDGEEHSFTVKLYGEDLDWMINKDNPVFDEHTKSSIELIKLDEDTEEPLEGVEFEFYNEDDELLGTFFTGEDGRIETGDLPLGKYYFKEKNPLEGYETLEDDVVFDVKKDGKEYSATVYNKKIAEKPDTPKLGTFNAFRVFCGAFVAVLLVLLGLVWFAKKRR